MCKKWMWCTCTVVQNAFLLLTKFCDHPVQCYWSDHLLLFFGYQTLFCGFIVMLKDWSKRNEVDWLRSVDILWVYSRCLDMPISLSSHFLLHVVCFFMLNPSSTLSYIQVHRYLIGFQRLMASLGNTVKTYVDRRGWGTVGQPPIRRVRSQILLYLTKPMSWVEV
jgi:hypothetical protein